MSESVRIEAIKARADAATLGPWTVPYPGSRVIEAVDQENGLDTVVVDSFNDGIGAGVLSEADAEFIAHARTDIPDLLAQLRLAESDSDEANTLIERQAKILTEVANVLNGPPPPLTTWSHHDLAEKAAALASRTSGE